MKRTDDKIIDVSNIPLGRAASVVAFSLIGKDETDYTPNQLISFKVIITGIDKIKISQSKLSSVTYYRHSGYPGALKKEKLSDRAIKGLDIVFIETVKRMLPDNKMRKPRLKKLFFK